MPLDYGRNTLMATPLHSQLDALRLVLPRLLGDIDEATFEAICSNLTWVELAGGEVLFREGDPSDALYLLISGRLQAIVACADGLPQVVGEIGRGESVGEMGVFSGKPRRADVVAMRDSVLARIELAAVHAIVKAAPVVALSLNRVIIERLQRRNTSQKPSRNVTNVAVVSVSKGRATGAMLRKLIAELEGQQQAALHLTSESIDAAAGRAGAAQATDKDANAHYWLVNYLDELEGRYSLVFYEADPTPTEWTRRCLRQADEVLLLANAGASPELSETELACLGSSTTRVRQNLVLLHPAGVTWPEGTLSFLAKRPNVQRHYHLRAGDRSDLARLARFLSGNAVGLVLAGGGARGLAHIGVFRALEEAGVPVDIFGGTSVGSVLAACMACDWGWEKVYSVNKREFLSNPTSDFNFIPLVSLLAGRKLDRILARVFGEWHIEEMWRPFFCVSSNYTRACEQVHTRSELKRALLASMAIPGVFPPVVSGNDLLVDGGVFNNMPVDVMARTGVRKILAVDLRPDNKQHRELTFKDVPSAWALLADRFRPEAQRRYHIPSMLTTLMAANTLNGEQKMCQVVADVDLLFHPDVRRFGLLEWKSFDLLVEKGYRHAQEVLAKHPWPF
jgi:NTE family protein